jgi:hypothetical protein
LATPTPKVSQTGCIRGTGDGNFKGLCEFNCQYNCQFYTLFRPNTKFSYRHLRIECPESVCTCTPRGTMVSAPKSQFDPGSPAAGLGESYSGLCSAACRLGYCPPTTCSLAQQTLEVSTGSTESAVSSPSLSTCTKGEVISSGELTGLYSYACNFGFCPSDVCRCTTQGTLISRPNQIGLR